MFVAITLDRLGQRYGCLPSEIIKTGNTFDLEVLDIALSYDQYQQNKKNGVTPQISTEAMLAALDKVKEDGNKSKNR